MGSLRSFFIVIALGVLLGPSVFVAGEEATPASGTASSAKLTCYICNDAIGKLCTGDPKTIKSMPCDNFEDFLAANKVLMSFERAGKDAARNSTPSYKTLKMSTQYASKNNTKILGDIHLNDAIKFACRKVMVEVHENDENKGKRLIRNIGSCSMYYTKTVAPHEHEDGKMECVSKAGSAKTKFTSCKCNSNNCNGASRLSQGFVAVLAVTTIVGLLAAF